MSNIAFIPARGGSKSIPLKNIKMFCGKPLIYWSLSELNNTELIDEIVVATDSDLIQDVVENFFLKKVKVFRRSSENATDSASTESVILEYINRATYNDDDVFLLVQLTSPFTQSVHFFEALNRYYTSSVDSLLSVVQYKRFIWGANGNPLNYDYMARPRRQDFNECYLENGAFYINKVRNIKMSKNRLTGKIGYYVMPEYSSIEIDEPEDWTIAEKTMRKYILKKTKLSNIKIVLTDVDGCLTDSGMYYLNNGEEIKKFSTYDGMGFEILRNHGFRTGIITSENTKIVSNRAKKIKCDYLYQGIKNKLEIIKKICIHENCNLSSVAYLGDDINDLQVLENVGLSFCPQNAVESVKKIENINILEKKGGEGAFREMVNIILEVMNG